MDSEPKKAVIDEEEQAEREMYEVDDWLEAMCDMILMDEKYKDDSIDIETGNYILLESDNEDEIEIWKISRGRDEGCGRA
jgi:hypothetical protein